MECGILNDMDHLEVLRDKVERLRAEIAEIKLLNERHRLRAGDGAEAREAHLKRHERLQEIQKELVQVSNLGNKALSAEERIEKHLSRLHPVKRAS
jgi:hypothetical protein